MTDFCKGIIDLIKAGLTGEKAVLPEAFDFEKAYKLGKSHQIIPILYRGMINSNTDIPDDIKNKFKTQTYKSMLYSEKQLFELKRIFSEFDKHSIEYMPLKGSIIKHLYPSHEMREMGDADILIKPERYPEIKNIMIGLGFRESVESEYDITWIKEGHLHLELHHQFYSNDLNSDFYNYYKDPWSFANKTENGKYLMSDEDFYIYLFTHFAKHFRVAGIGIKHIVDFYIFRINKPYLNIDHIISELGKLGLAEFYRNTVNTLNVWFDKKEPDEITDFITSTIFNSGAFGTEEKMLIGVAQNNTKSNSYKKIKAAKIFSTVFPPVKAMRNLYPILKKLPLLLPIMWVVRWFEVLFTRPQNIKKQKEKLDTISSDSIDAFNKSLEYVGLGRNIQS